MDIFFLNRAVVCALPNTTNQECQAVSMAEWIDARFHLLKECSLQSVLFLVEDCWTRFLPFCAFEYETVCLVAP